MKETKATGWELVAVWLGLILISWFFVAGVVAMVWLVPGVGVVMALAALVCIAHAYWRAGVSR